MMYQERDLYLHDHEINFIESMYTKIVYGRRKAEDSEEATIKRMYRIFLSRKLK